MFRATFKLSSEHGRFTKKDVERNDVGEPASGTHVRGVSCYP